MDEQIEKTLEKIDGLDLSDSVAICDLHERARGGFDVSDLKALATYVRELEQLKVIVELEKARADHYFTLKIDEHVFEDCAYCQEPEPDPRAFRETA